MLLKEFIFVNWGNLPNQVFEFGPINLFSGGNGSGKTTAADAIQTLMTAAHDNLYSYNPGQDESTQRSRGKMVRTLASYILGCDDGSYSRPCRTDGYLVANFQPSEGEDAQPFSAIMHARAHLETANGSRVARLDNLNFYILRENHLKLADLIESGLVTDGSRLNRRLGQRYSSHLIEKYDRKKSYLARLYGALRGRDDAVNEREALHAAKSFSRFMAYKPVRSINDFVANEVLERKDLGEAIRNVSSLMKTIHSMESQAAKLRDAITTLDEASRCAIKFVDGWIETNELSLVSAHAKYNAHHRAYVEAKRNQQDLKQKISANAQEREALDDSLSALHRQLVQFEAQRQGGEGVEERKQLEGLKALLQKQTQSVVGSIRKFNEHREHAQELARLIVDLDVGEMGEALRESSAAFVEVKAMDPKSVLGSDWVDEASLVSLLETATGAQHVADRFVSVCDPASLGGELYDALQRQKMNAARRVEELKQQVSSLQVDVDALEQSRKTYPRHIAEAVRILNEALPEADVRVLCDYIEVTDPRWQNAIEGFIGGARYNLIVDEAFEAKATGILRDNPTLSKAVRVLQGAKAKADCRKLSRLPHDSIVHLMRFDHSSAEAFITASFGNVVQVDTTSELANVRRGLMAKGLGAAGYAMFKCSVNDDELVFGRSARDKAKLVKREQLTKALSELAQHLKVGEHVQRVLKLVTSVSSFDLAAPLRTLVETVDALSKQQKLVDLADAGNHGELEAQISALFEQEAQSREALAALQSSLGGLENELLKVNAEVTRYDSLSESVEQELETAEENLRRTAARWSEYDVEAALIRCEERATSGTIKSLEAEAQAKRDLLALAVAELEQGIIRYNREQGERGAISFMPATRQISSELYQTVVNTHTEIDELYNRLKNNVLAKKYDQIAQYKESFDNIFVTHLCHSVYQAVSDGQRALEDLNQELQHHAFGADRERYSFDWDWEPEFKEYWDFFAVVTRTPNVDGQVASLFSQELDAKFGKVRDKLISMLLDEDEAKAIKHLEELTDYRSYRRYEIYKTPEGKEPIPLSQYGTGSGGQLETPAYIIRAAAVTSAFKFGEPGAHLRLVLVDEAFSKMDEYRSREVINYLTERLGLQLSFVMPTSKSGPFMDVISNQFVFAKVPVESNRGELATGVLVDRQKLNQERVAELWESHRNQLRSQAEMEFLAEL